MLLFHVNMKKTLLLLLFFYSLQAAGQVSPLPLDSITHKVTYQGVVRVIGASQADLYSRAREWFATSFGPDKAVLEMDDRQTGKLVGNASSTFFMAGGSGSAVPMLVQRRIRVEVKDGRYHYTITDFTLSSGQPPQTETSTVERWLIPNRLTFNKDGSPKATTVSVFDGVRLSSESEAASLRLAMRTAGKVNSFR